MVRKDASILALIPRLQCEFWRRVLLYTYRRLVAEQLGRGSHDDEDRNNSQAIFARDQPVGSRLGTLPYMQLFH